MFVVILRYLKPMDEVEARTAEHRAWLDPHVRSGLLIATGPMVPRTGGVLLARGGGTRMVDTITVASPVLGRIVEPRVLVPYLRRLIIRRNTHLLDVLDARDGAPHDVSDGTGLR